MREIMEYKKAKKIVESLMALSFLAFIIGIIIFVWFGFIGIKITITSFILMILFYLLSKSANEIIINITKGGESDETD